MFAYCMNNPVMGVDPDGDWSTAAIAAGAVGAALCLAAFTVLTAGVGTASLVGAVAVGAAKGTLIGAGAGAAIGAIAGGITEKSIDGVISGAAMGLGAGAAIGAVAGGTLSGFQFGTFSSKKALTDHFIKHGKEFGDLFANPQEYAKGAQYVIKNGTYIPEKNGYIKFLGAKGTANYAFVGMKEGGRVATFHVEGVSKLMKAGVSIFG